MPIVPSRNTRSYFYEDDEGRTWTIRMKQEIAEQADATGSIVGAIPYTGGAVAGPWPNSWTPRAVQVANPTGGSRYVVCPQDEGRLFTGGATVIELRNADGTVLPFTRVGIRPERKKPLNLPGA